MGDTVVGLCPTPSSKKTRETISNLGWGILPDAPYSSDLCPYYCHLFRFLQHHLVDSHFKSIKQVEKRVHESIASKSPSFFQAAIRQLPERWYKYVDSDGDSTAITSTIEFVISIFINKFKFVCL